MALLHFTDYTVFFLCSLWICFKCNLVHCTLVQSFFYVFSSCSSFVRVRCVCVWAFFSKCFASLSGCCSKWNLTVATPTVGAIMAIGLRRSEFLFRPVWLCVGFFFSFVCFVFFFSVCPFFVIDFNGNVALVLFVLLPLTAVGNH